MRWTLWIIGLFALAVVAAFGLGHNHGMATIFWPPYRVDVSLTLAVLVLGFAFVFLHFAWRGLVGLSQLPQRARRWRFESKRHAAQTHFQQALLDQLGGRYVRVDKSANKALVLLDEVDGFTFLSRDERNWLAHLRWLTLWVLAESRQALRDVEGRQHAVQRWLQVQSEHAPLQRTEVTDAAALSQARWLLDGREPEAAQSALNGLSRGASHRTLALRLKLKALRQAGEFVAALPTARLLAKHGGFSPEASDRLLQGLALACLDQCRDASQLFKAWSDLDAADRARAPVALRAAELGLRDQVDPTWLMERLNRVWSVWSEQPQALSEAEVHAFVVTLTAALALSAPDVKWLERIESAHLRQPRVAELQLLCGLVCVQHALWGKAQSLLEAAAKRLESEALQRRAHVALAQLAESRGDDAAALQAWKRAAQT